MNLVRRYLNYPHLILSVIFMGVALGVLSFNRLPLNLFPDANYPAVSVLLIWPGAAAQDVEDRVTRQVDTELASLDQSRRVKAVTRDEVSAITVEFEYEKGISAAVVDVSSALDRIRASLPADMLPPRIFKIIDATAPVATLAIRPNNDAVPDMIKVRQICDNDLRNFLLRLPDVARVEVFGGHKPEVRIALNQDLIRAHNLDIGEIAAAIAVQNRNIPGGTIIRDQEQFLITIHQEKLEFENLLDIVLKKEGSGVVHLRDIANISADSEDRFSFFHGNGKPAIAVNILRPETGHVTTTLNTLKKALPELKKEFSNLEIEIVDTSGDIIETSISNMVSALRDAILLTVGVIFILLARTRATLLTAISIPFTFLLTFAGMDLLGLELNIVTLTGIILAVGLLVDDSIVVIENIDRHMRMPGNTPKEAAIVGTQEIYLADFSGTLTTLVVLLPVMFVGGYAQKILRPLSMTLSLALSFSYVVSVTVIPLLAPYLQGSFGWEEKLSHGLTRFSEFLLEPVRKLFSRLFVLAEHRRLLFIVAGVVLLVISMRQMPLVGRDLMPPMDTGIVKISFETGAGSPVSSTEEIARTMETMIRQIPGFVRMSTLVGSESGVISFGAERTPQEGTITVHFVDRFKRKSTIWEIEAALRLKFEAIPGMKSVEVYDYGATPLSSISAPIDVRITGPDPEILNRLAEEVLNRLSKVKGLTDISRSWEMNKKEMVLILNPEQLARYGIDPVRVGQVLNTSTQGVRATMMRVSGQLGYAVTLKYSGSGLKNRGDLEMLTVASPKGPVPLKELGHFEQRLKQTRLIREDLNSVVNIHGFRSTTAISHIQDQVDSTLAEMVLPSGYEIRQKGEIMNMNESFSNLGKAMVIAIILVYFTMVPVFRSFVHPLTVMIAIPLAFIGISWAMLLAGRHFCMPASMGMILLSGIVVNNSILLMDFIQQARAQGKTRNEAVLGAIRTRARPIIMTAASTIVGMLPIAMEMAVGLERLSPLAVVAIGGLLVSTFLTLLYIPIFYTLADDMLGFFSKVTVTERV
ncbi:MAG: efflux RND transporter permease subunit [Proteobacteria bacterium]|nr:efflux RND transporter permease subunit [Pseudomonadota bacterium]